MTPVGRWIDRLKGGVMLISFRQCYELAKLLADSEYHTAEVANDICMDCWISLSEDEWTPSPFMVDLLDTVKDIKLPPDVAATVATLQAMFGKEN